MFYNSAQTYMLTIEQLRQNIYFQQYFITFENPFFLIQSINLYQMSVYRTNDSHLQKQMKLTSIFHIQQENTQNQHLGLSNNKNSSQQIFGPKSSKITGNISKNTINHCIITYQKSKNNLQQKIKEIADNYLTINIIQSQNSISSSKQDLKDIKQMLVRHSQHKTAQYYQDSSLQKLLRNKEMGRLKNKYPQEYWSKKLSKDVSKSRLKQNSYHSQHFNSIGYRNRQVRLSQIQQVNKFSKNTCKKSVKNCRNLYRGMDNWKLKDFYDPIIDEVQLNDLKSKKLKERSNILFRLKIINDDCIKLQNDKNLSENVDAFGQYSSKFSKILIRKQRKIDKIKLIS